MGKSLAFIQDMEATLGRSETDMTPWFLEEWIRGCGVKHGVKAFFEAKPKPYRTAFWDRIYKTTRRIGDGD
ncbi:hypothetical protein [Algirhabdus cladophorae]|uniref:hypothetical protein n=1 Tax=Algirhabdus cladophorae TaxID=3377108 RepID=UPI003B846DBD